MAQVPYPSLPVTSVGKLAATAKATSEKLHRAFPPGLHCFPEMRDVGGVTVGSPSYVVCPSTNLCIVGHPGTHSTSLVEAGPGEFHYQRYPCISMHPGYGMVHMLGYEAEGTG